MRLITQKLYFGQHLIQLARVNVEKDDAADDVVTNPAAM
jgi:hypothetical protein